MYQRTRNIPWHALAYDASDPDYEGCANDAAPHGNALGTFVVDLDMHCPGHGTYDPTKRRRPGSRSNPRDLGGVLSTCHR